MYCKAYVITDNCNWTKQAN